MTTTATAAPRGCTCPPCCCDHGGTVCRARGCTPCTTPTTTTGDTR